jgi:hypothetical protein
MIHARNRMNNFGRKVDSRNYMAVGSNYSSDAVQGSILFTTNASEKWIVIQLDGIKYFVDIHFTYTDAAWFVDYDGNVWKGTVTIMSSSTRHLIYGGSWASWAKPIPSLSQASESVFLKINALCAFITSQ